MVVVGDFVAQVALHLRGGHDAVAFLVDVHMDDVVATFHHFPLLFAERAEEVFHQSPAQEGAVLVDPRHFHVAELSHLGDGSLGGGYEALVLVEVDEHFQGVARSGVFWYIAGGQQDFAFLAAVEVEAEVHLLCHGQLVVVA